MQQVIARFAEKYQLTINEVIIEMERALSTLFSRWYRAEVFVYFRPDFQLTAVAYDRVAGVVRQRVVDLKKIPGTTSIIRQIENSLSMATIIKQTRQYKFYEKEIRWGEIAKVDQEKNLHIEIEVLPGETVMAVCPLNRIGIHEQNAPSLARGQRRAFHVRRVDALMLGGTPRLNVVLDRVSKCLVEALLREQLLGVTENTVIRCTKRYVGKKSFVITSRRIPRAAIIAVARELGEPLQVKYCQTQ